MSRCYLDTNFIYAHLRAKRDTTLEQVESWRTRVLSEIDQASGVVSGLVMDEVAYRLILAWLRDDGDADPHSSYRADARKAMRATRRRLRATWRSIDSLALELQPTERAVIETAKTLMSKPGLAPRDAFHAAHALTAQCPLIASSDTGFDEVPGLRRIAP